MTNEPKMAPQTPAPDAADQSGKNASDTKPGVAAPAVAPVVAPIDTKKI
jgi:hypothetical protein